MKSNYCLLLIGILFSPFAGTAKYLEKDINVSRILERDTVIDKYRKSYWIELGPGWSSRDMAFNASLNLEMEKRWIVSISSENVFSTDPIVSSLLIFPLILGGPVFEPGYDFNAVNLKLGKAVKGKAGLIVFSGGLSVVKGTKYSSYAEPSTTSGVGAAFDIKFLLAKNFLGLSFNPFFNINEIESYGGLTINIALGQVNYEK